MNETEEIRELEKKLLSLRLEEGAIGKTFSVLKRLSAKLEAKKAKMQKRIKKLKDLKTEEAK